MKNKIKRIVIIAIIGIISLFFMNKSLAANTGKVCVETAKLREEANVDCKVLELISINEEVEILEKTGQWYKVKYNEITGYLREDLLTVEEQQKTVSEETTEQVSNEEIPVQNPSEVTQTEETQKEETTTQETTTEQIETDIYGRKKVKEDTKLKIVPLINASSVIDVKAEEEVNVTEIINGWACVETSVAEGWIRQEKLKEIEEEKTEEKPEEEQQTPTENKVEVKTKYINSTTVNLRKEPSKDSEIVTTVAINTPVEVYSEDGSWSKVKVNDKEGYISSALLSDTKQETNRSMINPREPSEETPKVETNTNETSVQDTTKGATVVGTANKYLGYKYVYGGASPSTGFDCSGFTYYVFKQHGISLNRTAAGQYSNGVSVEKVNLQPGDLVMFGKSGINHVGIYIGGGRMIHSANPSRGVTTDTINSGYYYTNYVGARRVL